MVLHVFIYLFGGVPLCIPYGLYSGTSLGGTTRGTLEGYPGRVLSKSPQANVTEVGDVSDMNLSAVVFEVNFIGSNTKEWWVDTGATCNTLKYTLVVFDMFRVY